MQAVTITQISPDELRELVDTTVRKVLSETSTPVLQPAEQAPVEIMDGVETCKRFGISEPTLRRYREAGKIPYLTIGGSYRYNFAEVLAAISSMKRNKKS